jgi:hypothetical protein
MSIYLASKTVVVVAGRDPIPRAHDVVGRANRPA